MKKVAPKEVDEAAEEEYLARRDEERIEAIEGKGFLNSLTAVFESADHK